MVECVTDDLTNALRREKRPLPVDARDLCVAHDGARLDGVDVVDAKRQHVLVADRVDDRVAVQLVAERLLRGAKVRVAARAGIRAEDRRAGEAEQVVLLECLGDSRVHAAELTAVTFVEDDDHVPVVDRVVAVLLDKARELLDGGDDDSRAGVGQLLGKHPRRGVRVRRALLEPLVLAHGLVVKVLAVDNEQHLVNVRQAACELCGLEAGEGLARPRGVPHVATGGATAELLVVR